MNGTNRGGWVVIGAYTDGGRRLAITVGVGYDSAADAAAHVPFYAGNAPDMTFRVAPADAARDGGPAWDETPNPAAVRNRLTATAAYYRSWRIAYRAAAAVRTRGRFMSRDVFRGYERAETAAVIRLARIGAVLARRYGVFPGDVIPAARSAGTMPAALPHAI